MAKKDAGKADPQLLDGNQLRILVCVARFNSDITYAMRDLCIERLIELGVAPAAIIVAEVPGSFELPMATKQWFHATTLHAAIAIGAVIRGETDHYEHIARAAADGLQRVAIERMKPVIFGVLTTDNVKQAQARIQHAMGYAESAIEMVNTRRLRLTAQDMQRKSQ